MALTPETEDPFFREVDEELRRERLEEFGKRYGLWLVLAVVGALAIFAAVLWWRHHQQERIDAAGEQFTGILYEIGQGKTDAARPKLDAMAKSPIASYRALTLLTEAGMALNKGDTRSAVAHYAALTADKSLPQPMRDAALLRQVTVQYDTLPPATVIARLKPLAVAGTPWFGSAGELVALAYLKLGKPELAGPLFAAIGADATVSGTLRSRALQMARSLGADEAAAKPTGPTKG